MQDPKASMNSNTFIEEWSAYALEHSQSIPDLLLELEKETYQKVLQPRMLSSPLQGRFLSLLSQLIKPKKILEIGTFTGYASLCLAEGLQKEGELHTIDNNAELVHLQEKYFTRSEYEKNIHTYLGDATDIIPDIDGLFDLVFIDADKINYDAYFEQVLPKTKKGGLIISDNVMWSGKVLNKASTKDKSTVALQAYNIKLKLDSRIKTVLLPFRDGLTLSWVL